jgi:hypothetical protein
MPGEHASICAPFCCAFLRFPRRGGNYNNTSNTGLGNVNSNNTRSNTNTNYGVRGGFLVTSLLKNALRGPLRR